MATKPPKLDFKKSYMRRKSRQLLFYERNREKLLPIRREYARLHKKEKSDYDKEYSLINKNKKEKYHQEHREERSIYAKEYRKIHKEKLANYRRVRLKNDLQYKLANTLRSRLSKVLKGQKTGSAVGDLGCTIFEFKNYIESKFQPDMSWDKMGQIHLDHIIPLSSFDLTDKSQLVKAVHYTNLQPLWAIDNFK